MVLQALSSNTSLIMAVISVRIGLMFLKTVIAIKRTVSYDDGQFTSRILKPFYSSSFPLLIRMSIHQVWQYNDLYNNDNEERVISERRFQEGRWRR
jgi:hypothetical protein